MMVDDLFEDMKDGVKLLALLEVLSGQKLVRMFSVTRLVKLFPFGIWGLWSWEYKGCYPRERNFFSFAVGNTQEALVYRSLLGPRNKFPFSFLHTYSRFKTLCIVVVILEVRVKNFIDNQSWLTTASVRHPGRFVGN